MSGHPEAQAMEFQVWVTQRYGAEPDWDWVRRNLPQIEQAYGKSVVMPAPVTKTEVRRYDRYSELD